VICSLDFYSVHELLSVEDLFDWLVDDATPENLGLVVNVELHGEDDN